MGTGKTRTALELISKRFNDKKINHILWLCPCSVKVTIEREIEKHLEDDLAVFTICGIETLSSSIKTNALLLELVQEKQVYLIVDESNLVKNHHAQRTKNIMRLAEYCRYKLILNGTPISRNEKDLFSQWYILDYRILGYQSFWSFAANHLEYDDKVRGKVKRTLNVDYLVRKIAPYSYQVKKEECLTLPRKTYSTYYYELTEEQREHYSWVKYHLLQEVNELEPSTLYRLFAGLQNVIAGYHIQVGEHFDKRSIFTNPLDNPRMQMLLGRLETSDEKFIIFCKYADEIRDIVATLNDRFGEGTAVPFDGSVTQKERQMNIERFSSSSRFFVANKMTAGYGLNLQFCHYVIFYNNDWDFATRSQAEDRVHRIGQEHNVHIIDFCAAQTLDERILKCLYRKERLVDCFKGWIEKMKDKKDLHAMNEWIEGIEKE